MTTNSPTTSYHSPFALVRGYGHVPGQRPRTREAFIVEAIAEGGEVTQYRVRHVLLTRRGEKYGRAQTIPAAHIVKTWRTRPTESQLRNAKKALKAIPA